MWKVIDTGIKSATENMQVDHDLLEHLDPNGDPILHFYDWKDKSATYGHFIDVKKFLHLNKVKDLGLDLGKRPTGGGVVFHVSDLAFSVLVPANHQAYSLNTLENYAFVNQIVLQSTQAFLNKHKLHLLDQDPTQFEPSCMHFCMAKPTVYDVMVGGKKVAGAAQRRRKQGFLHQGTISIAMPQEDFLKEVLLEGSPVLNAMKALTWSILPNGWTEDQLADVRQELKSHLQEGFLGS